jgi:hypothetical protein
VVSFIDSNFKSSVWMLFVSVSSSTFSVSFSSSLVSPQSVVLSFSSVRTGGSLEGISCVLSE